MKMVGGEKYNLKYEKRYGSSFRNPWSQEVLLQNGIRGFGGNDQCLWIHSGANAYCFIKDFDNVEYSLSQLSASEAQDYLENNYDRKENIQEVIDKWIK